jgi:hypothetical protein
MCIACEMALMMALDELSDEPPPGFPRLRRDEATGFACDVPEEAKPAPQPPEDERKP